jgi:PAS domain S-box-containing protein
MAENISDNRPGRRGEQAPLFPISREAAASARGRRGKLKDRKKALFGSAPEIAWVKDADGRFIAASAMFAEACGVPQRRLIGKTDWDIWPAGLAEKYSGHEKKIMDSGVPGRVSFASAGLSAADKPAEIVVAPIVGGDGQVIGTLGIARDVSPYQETADRLRLVSRQVIRAREEEKKKISGLLHDEIGSFIMRLNAALFLAGEELSGAAAGKAEARLGEAKAALGELAAAVRRICFDIRPPALGVLGLAGAVEELTFRLGACTGVEIEWEASLPDEKKADELVEIIIYRAVQEAIGNAIKHSGAGTVRVSLACSGGRLKFSVSDDGKGFDTSAAAGVKEKRTLGLGIMREEAESVCGEISVSSMPGFGTVVSGDFPLRPEASGGGYAR